MTNDKILVQRSLSGDIAAFEELVKGHQRLVNHIVTRIVPKVEDREDLCQEVFIKVYNGLRDFQFECKLSSWIGRVAYNSALNFKAKRRVPTFSDLAVEDADADSFAAKRLDQLSDIEKSDMSSRLREEIASLPVKSRLVVTLYHLDQLTYEEIADIMKIPMNTVKSHLFRGRRRLKEKILMKYSREDLCA